MRLNAPSFFHIRNAVAVLCARGAQIFRHKVPMLCALCALGCLNATGAIADSYLWTTQGGAFVTPGGAVADVQAAMIGVYCIGYESGCIGYSGTAAYVAGAVTSSACLDGSGYCGFVITHVIDVDLSYPEEVLVLGRTLIPGAAGGGGGGGGGSSMVYSPFEMLSNQNGVDIGVAIGLVWALAFSFVLVRRALQ